MTQILLIICVSLYLICSYQLWCRIKGNTEQHHSEKSIFLMSISGLLIHSWLLISKILENSPINISLTTTVAIAGWASVLIYVLISIKPRNAYLGIVLLPIGIVAVLLTAISSTGSALTSGTEWHIILAIPTYGVMCIAFAQACLLIIQDQKLNKVSGSRFMPRLPPIQTMESSLFLLILTGFLLMTLNILIGFAANILSKGAYWDFSHHTVLSIVAWICFGCLILGKYKAGWRGQIAAKWTVFAFSVLVLAYFGTRFVRDIIL